MAEKKRLLTAVFLPYLFLFFFFSEQTPNLEVPFHFHEIIVRNLAEQTCDTTRVVGSVTPEKVTLDGSMKKYIPQQTIFQLCFNAGKLAEQNGNNFFLSRNHGIYISFVLRILFNFILFKIPQ